MQHARIDYNARIQDSAGIIPEDEPVFLIRARDIAGVTAIGEWVRTAERCGVAVEVVAAVRRHHFAMLEWAGKHGGFKTPDTPEGLLIGGK